MDRIEYYATPAKFISPDPSTIPIPVFDTSPLKVARKRKTKKHTVIPEQNHIDKDKTSILLRILKKQ